MQMSAEDYADVFSNASRLKAPRVTRSITDGAGDVVFLVWGKGRLGGFYVAVSNAHQSCHGIEAFKGVCVGIVDEGTYHPVP